MNNNQLIAKKKRILETFKMFFECQSIREVSVKTGISKSCVQRHLYDPLAIELLGIEIMNKVQARLLENRVEANHRGGVNFLNLYMKTRNELGQFNGCKKAEKI